MKLNELQTFLEIIRTGSLVKASEVLNITQSTVTTRLKSLEQTVGQTLLVRQKSGVVLTPAGTRLKRYAETISELWRQARQETALPKGIDLVYNIGCHPDLWPSLGKNLFDNLRDAQKSSAISIWQGTDAELSKWLNSGLIDISLTYWPSAQSNQSVYPLAQDRLILVSTKPNDAIKFNPNYVFIEAGEEFGLQHAAAYARADTAKLSFGNACLGLEHILEHGGSAYLPIRIATPYIEKQELYHLNAPEFDRKAYMIKSASVSLDIDWLIKPSAPRDWA